MGTINYSKLLTFVVFSVAYMAIYKPHWRYPPETIGAALFKILPILSLVVYVLPQGKPLSSLTTVQRNTIIGLLVSAIGDICLVWRTTLFVPGVVAFGIAHVFYLNAFGLSYTSPTGESQPKSRSLPMFAVASVGCGVLVFQKVPTIPMKYLTFCYSVLLFTLAWRATVRYEYERNGKSLAGCLGTIFFLFSDIVIGVDRWVFSMPGSYGLVMMTYYAAQLGISISAS